MQIHIAEDERELALLAADLVCDVIARKPDAVLGLPSGKTPLGLYDELAARVENGRASLSGVTAFAIDELYGVPAEHPATNASYFRTHVVSRIALRACHVLDSSAGDPVAECARFTALIEAAGGLDLVVLGIGVNGHVAFNEPGAELDSRTRVVDLDPSTRETYAAAFGSLDAAPARGLTLGIADILEAREALLLATGEPKADIIAQALLGPVDIALPASALQRHEDFTVVLDRAAAANLVTAKPKH